MFNRPKFYGSTTVGDRGQIVLPIELRKQYDINAGDKLLVVGAPEDDQHNIKPIMLLKAKVLNQILSYMQIQESAIKKILEEEQNEDK